MPRDIDPMRTAFAISYIRDCMEPTQSETDNDQRHNETVILAVDTLAASCTPTQIAAISLLVTAARNAGIRSKL